MPNKKLDIEPIIQKKNIASKFKDSLMATGEIDIKNHIIKEVITPALCDLAAQIRDSIFGALQDASDILIFGETRSRSSLKNRNINSSRGYTSYSTIARDASTRVNNKYSQNTDSVIIRGRYLDEIIAFRTRAEADELKSEMADIIEETGSVSVFELYDLMGKTAEFIYRDWGWDSMANISVQRTNNGFELILPRITRLK